MKPGGSRFVPSLLWMLLVPGVSVAGAMPDACAERWSLNGVRLGTSTDSVRTALSASKARLRDPDDARSMVWQLSRGRRLAIDLEPDGGSVRRVTLLVSKPDEKFPELLEHYGSRWGAPEVHRHIVGDDRADRLTEASVWLDLECDVKATVLGIKERNATGIEFLKYGVRIEPAVDPIGHLQFLRSEISG